MNVWRINLKPGSASGIDPRKLCLTNGIVGVGWQIDYTKEPIDWETYEKEATKIYYDKGDKSWRPAINAIHNRMKLDDLIWTRDWQGVYYVGRITSDWYYDTSRDCEQADMINVRKCDWQKVGTIEAVPGKIVNSFIPARTVQRVTGDTIEIFSKYIYNKISGNQFYQIKIADNSSIFSLLSSDDCEDILGLYLQLNRNYMIVPSSCKSDTMNYEYELIDRANGQKAVVQVKNGDVNLNIKDYSDIDSKIYLFTTKGNYIGKLTENIEFMESDKMEKFVFEMTNLMPQKIKNWIEIYTELKQPAPNND